jgi:hypothetical protein
MTGIEIGLALAAAGALTGAAGTIAAGQTQGAMMKAKAQQDEYAARQYVARGKIEQGQARQKADYMKKKSLAAQGRAQAVMAASGLQVDPTVTAALASYGTFEELKINAGGKLQRWDNENQARAKRYGAKVQRAGAQAVRQASYLDAAGTILGGAGSMFGKFDTSAGSGATGWQTTVYKGDTYGGTMYA